MLCFSWQTADEHDAAADGRHNIGYFGYKIFGENEKILVSRKLKFADLEEHDKQCTSEKISKFNFFTDNGNAWHGLIYISDSKGQNVKISCENCQNDIGQSNRIVVDTDINRYRSWYSKSMACQGNCIIKPHYSQPEIKTKFNPCFNKDTGYYRDQTDCHKFFICNNDIFYSKSCPTGLSWNDSIKTCDYPRNVDCK